MLVVLLALALQPSTATVIDRIMAVVGSQPIMLSDGVTAATVFHLVDPPPGTADPCLTSSGGSSDGRSFSRKSIAFSLRSPTKSRSRCASTIWRSRPGHRRRSNGSSPSPGLTRDQLRRHIRDDLRIRTYLLERFGADRPEVEFNTMVDAWVAELRRRAQISVLYQRT